jgi:DUF4097 and DUF4098 domain-containing protein YvlB
MIAVPGVYVVVTIVIPAGAMLRYTGVAMGKRFPLPPGARLRVLSVSGKVEIEAEDVSELEIEPPDRYFEVSDDNLVVETRSKSTDLHIIVPIGTNVSVGAVSGRVSLSGRFGSVKVSTVSGHIEVDETAGDVDVRSISGHLEVERCEGRCRANTKSGRIEIGWVGREARAQTMSGSIEVGTAGEEDIELRTISGKIRIEVDPGRHPNLHLKTLSGKARTELESGSDFEIRARTISGSIQVEER